jgi:hypothetical protein
MFDSYRVTREQALNYPELVSGKRGLFGPAAVKVTEDAVKDGVAKKTWGQRLKSLALNTVIGGGAAIVGTSIYEKINPNSKALGMGGSSESQPVTSATTGDPTIGTTTGPGYGPYSSTASPGYGTTSPGYGTTSPGYGTTGSGSSYGSAYSSGYSNTGTGYTGTGGYATTSPSYGGATTGSSASVTPSPGYSGATSTSGTPGTRAIAERAREEHAFDNELPADIFSESSIPSHIYTALLIVSSQLRS